MASAWNSRAAQAQAIAAIREGRIRRMDKLSFVRGAGAYRLLGPLE
jgi:hypothetical protein